MADGGRDAALRDWYAERSGGAAALRPISGDASFRRYFRTVTPEGRSIILCDSPPASEKNAEFVAIAEALAAAGVRVPAILDTDLEHGFLALEDLGDSTLLPALGDDSVDRWYAQALAMLESLAVMDAPANVPAYDRGRLVDEMNLFLQWFCDALLGIPLSDADRSCFAALRDLLCERALAQPQVVVHRDFHARNLMCLPGGELATIDFQDAVVGPVTYDPVSLLRDCYIRWPTARVQAWAVAHRERLATRGVRVPPADAFLVDFDWMGLQRHIKVLGIFARLFRRDGKPAYLGDLPRVIAYVREALGAYPAEPRLADFLAWFDTRVMPRATQQAWFEQS